MNQGSRTTAGAHPRAPAVVLRHDEVGYRVGIGVTPRDRSEHERHAREPRDDGGEQRHDSPKEDLFVELAVRDSARMSEVWIDEGLDAVVREVVELDPAWLSVYLELFRRARTDPYFKTRFEARHKDLAAVNRARIEEAQRDGDLREDLSAKEIGTFVNLVLNGLAPLRAGGEELPSTELVLRLLRDAIGGARRDTPARTPA